MLTDDAAELTFYVAYPIPAFSDQGTDGTIKDVVFTVDGTEYAAESDITAKPEKVFDTDASLFGISAGDELPTQVLSVELPRDVLDELAAGTVSASAYVNVFMNTTQNFFCEGDRSAGSRRFPGNGNRQPGHADHRGSERRGIRAFLHGNRSGIRSHGQLKYGTGECPVLYRKGRGGRSERDHFGFCSAGRQPGQRRKQSVLCQQFWNTDGIRGYRGNRP